MGARENKLHKLIHISQIFTDDDFTCVFSTLLKFEIYFLGLK